MKIAILGDGQLGTQMFVQLSKHFECTMFKYPQFNVCNGQQLCDIVTEYDVIVNCTANTNVDKIQRQQRNNSIAVNHIAVSNLATLCKMFEKKLVHISTDYVYGSNGSDILSQLNPTEPINCYGKDKLGGDLSIIGNMYISQYLILRVSWLFGKYGENNFIEKLKNNLLNNNQIKVVDDQIGNITSTKLVIKAVKQYLSGLLPGGLYNIQNSGQYVSRFQIAQYLKQLIGSNCTIKRCKTSDFILPAQRQLNSRLSTDRIDLFMQLTNWKQQLKQYLTQTE